VTAVLAVVLTGVRWIVVANAKGTTLSFIDTATDEAPVGDGSIQVHVSPDGRYLPVANQGAEESPGPTASVPVGAKPNGISFAPLVPAAPPSPTLDLGLGKQPHADGEGGSRRGRRARRRAARAGVAPGERCDLAFTATEPGT
jgi:hypothetical protein